MKRFIAMSSLLSLTACVHQVDAGRYADDDEREDYRISVEIPLENMRIEDDAILKVDELLEERTHFKADDFQLDEVVLVGRGDGEDGNAELLVLEWRSGQFAVPEGGADEWYEVRIPAPSEDLEGAWLLDITGAVTVDLLVAVLAPRPPLVEVAKTTTRRTRTTYGGALPTTEHRHWIYEPSRYYVYHYHDVWAYRYFIGPWSYRYYDLAFRPYRHHYGPLFRPYRPHGRHRPRSYGQWQDRNYRDEARQRGRAAEAPRRIDAELVKLRRSHPRLRAFHGGARREGDSDRAEHSTRQQRYEEAKRSHPRLRAFHRQTNGRALQRRTAPASEANVGVSPPRRAVPAAGERDAALGRVSNRRGAAPARTLPRTGRAEGRTTSAVPARSQERISQPRPSYRRPAATAQRPMRDVRAPVMRSSRASGAQPRTASPRASAERRAVRPATNVRTRSFQRQPRPRAAPQPTAAPRREPSRRAATPQRPARQAAPRQAPVTRSAPPAAETRRSSPNSRRFERR